MATAEAAHGHCVAVETRRKEPFSRQSPPPGGLLGVMIYCFSNVVHVSEAGLRKSVPLVSCPSAPFESLIVALGQPFARTIPVG